LYPATVKNMSIMGLSVHFGVHVDVSLTDVNIGDECKLYLIDDQLPPSPYEYETKIMRVDTSEIVLSILGMHLHS
jgi:hypothetical protein